MLIPVFIGGTEKKNLWVIDFETESRIGVSLKPEINAFLAVCQDIFSIMGDGDQGKPLKDSLM